MFVDSQRTSLYTLWDDDVLPQDYIREIGFVVHDQEGHIAFEFSDTKYERALHYLDTCIGCVDVPDEDLRRAATEELSNERYDDMDRTAMYAISTTYVNIDLPPYHLPSNDGRTLLMRGRIARYHPGLESHDDGTVSIVVAEVTPIVQPEDLSANVERIIAEFRSIQGEVDSKEVEETVEAFRTEESSGQAREALSDAYFLFNTLGLLRSAKETEPMSWKELLETLASDNMTKAHPEPWVRYTKSYCRVDNKRPECRAMGY